MRLSAVSAAPVRWLLIAASLVGVTLAGCGQTGNLTLPVPAPTPSAGTGEPIEDDADTNARDEDDESQ